MTWPAPVRAAFEAFLSRMNPANGDDLQTIERLYGRRPHGPLAELVARRSGDAEIGPFMVLSAKDAWAMDTLATPFETMLERRDRRLLAAVYADAVPIGRDGGGQEYVAHLDDPSEIALFDAGQAALRFLATDLPTFVFLAEVTERAYPLVEALELEDGDLDDKRDHPALVQLAADLAHVADRVSLDDPVVTSDFKDVLAMTTGTTPAFRPPRSAIEALHDRADWIVGVLGMGYDVVPLDDLADTFEEERADPTRWASAATRLYWLTSAFVLGEDARFEQLADELAGDPAAWVADAARMLRTLRPLASPEDAPSHLCDLVRARRSLSRLWRMPARRPSSPVVGEALPIALRRRTEFLARAGHCRDDCAYVEEVRECIAALRRADGTATATLFAMLDRPPSGGEANRENPIAAALLPDVIAPEHIDVLRDALVFRSRDLGHLAVLPGVVRALGRLGDRASVPQLLDLVTEHAPVWQYGYAKAGNLPILLAICDALAELGDDRAIDVLVALAERDTDVDAALPLRKRAIVALASTSWAPSDTFVARANEGGAREIVKWLLARRGEAPPPSLDDATQLLHTLHADPFVTRLAHRAALDVLDATLPPDDARAVLVRTIRSTLDEGVRRHAVALMKRRDADFAPTFCDRPTVEAALAEQGVQGLVHLLDAPCPVYRHNVFAIAAEANAQKSVVGHLPAFVADLAVHRHLWGGGLAYEFGTQLYAAIDCMRDLGPDAADAMVSLWRASPIMRERVEYTMKDLGYEGFEALEKAVRNVYILADEKRFDELVAENPSVVPAWRNLGHMRLGAGKYDEACEAYARAVTLDPNDAMGWYWLSQAHFNLQRWEEVERAASRGLAADPDSVRCRYNLALSLSARDRIDEARAIFGALLRCDLEGERWMIPDIHLNLAVIALDQKEPEAAAASLGSAFAADRAWLDHALAVPELVAAFGEAKIRDFAKNPPAPKAPARSPEKKAVPSKK